MPFVDHHYLFQGFEKRSYFLEATRNRFLLRILSKLILNDMFDENSLDFLFKLIRSNPQIVFNLDFDIKEIELAKCYQSLAS